ncbi:integrase [Archaeoglobales archaeon ex4484_92]|nr:MAG: integrase [Archaeoglobales archaeon ex4484_92]
MLMREIEAPFADKIKLPKAPKRRRIVVKIKDLKRLLSQVEQLNYAMALRTKAAILLSATSGIRAEELYKLTLENIDIENRTIYITAEIAKDYEDRVTFFSEEAKTALIEYLDNVKRMTSRLFPESNIKRALQQLNTKLRIKHMRKFFSQQSDRLGMPTAVKKILMDHSTRNDVDLSHYDFQDEEELKKIYDRYWKDFRILNKN